MFINYYTHAIIYWYGSISPFQPMQNQFQILGTLKIHDTQIFPKIVRYRFDTNTDTGIITALIKKPKQSLPLFLNVWDSALGTLTPEHQYTLYSGHRPLIGEIMTASITPWP